MKLVQFYRGEIPNANGVFIDDILAYNYSELEGDHEYIQWLLPNARPSMFHPNVPVLDDDQIVLFKSDPDLKSKFASAVCKMLDFYGMEIEDSHLRWQQPGNHKNPKWWLAFFNHNFLRITRMLTCLKLLGYEGLAKAVLQLLERENIDGESMGYWQDAVNES